MIKSQVNILWEIKGKLNYRCLGHLVLREKFNLRFRGRLKRVDKRRDGGAKHAETQFYSLQG